MKGIGLLLDGLGDLQVLLPVAKGIDARGLALVSVGLLLLLFGSLRTLMVPVVVGDLNWVI